MRRNWTAFAGAAALVALVACGGGDAEMGETEETGAAETQTPAPAQPAGAEMAMSLPEGVTPEMVAAGKTLFEGQALCVTCHGANGAGTALAPNLTDAEWLNISGRNYEEIIGVITNGVAQPKQFPSPMLPKAGTQITDEQVRAVAAYVYSLGQH